MSPEFTNMKLAIQDKTADVGEDTMSRLENCSPHQKMHGIHGKATCTPGELRGHEENRGEHQKLGMAARSPETSAQAK